MTLWVQEKYHPELSLVLVVSNTAVKDGTDIFEGYMWRIEHSVDLGFKEQEGTVQKACSK